MFIIKVTIKKNSFKWNLQRDKLLHVQSLQTFYS